MTLVGAHNNIHFQKETKDVLVWKNLRDTGAKLVWELDFLEPEIHPTDSFTAST